MQHDVMPYLPRGYEVELSDTFLNPTKRPGWFSRRPDVPEKRIGRGPRCEWDRPGDRDVQPARGAAITIIIIIITITIIIINISIIIIIISIIINNVVIIIIIIVIIITIIIRSCRAGWPRPTPSAASATSRSVGACDNK